MLCYAHQTSPLGGGVWESPDLSFLLEWGLGMRLGGGSGNETMSMQAMDERPCSAVHN